MKKNIQGQIDQDFDLKFRQAIGKGHHPFQEEDWEKMEAMLTANPIGSTMPNRKIGNSGWLFLCMFLFLAIGSIWLYDVSNHDFSDLESENHLVTKISANTQMGPELPTQFINMMSQFQPSEPFLAENGIRNQSIVGLSMQENQSVNDQRVEDQREGQPPLSKSLSFSDPAIQLMPKFLVENQPLDFTGLDLGDLISLTELKIMQPIFEKIPDPKPYPKKSLSLIYSPDLSVSQAISVNGLGINLGLNFEYFISKNSSINLGAIISRKIYQTDDVGGYGVPVYGSTLNADCFVWDIPLNLRHYFINRPNSRWYVNAGFSSYLMLKEKYEFNQDPNYPQYPNSYTVNNKNRHAFAIGNLGFGFEKILSESWSVQIEPYYKMSLSPIGEYGVNLNSTGFWLGLRYRW